MQAGAGTMAPHGCPKTTAWHPTARCRVGICTAAASPANQAACPTPRLSPQGSGLSCTPWCRRIGSSTAAGRSNGVVSSSSISISCSSSRSSTQGRLCLPTTFGMRRLPGARCARNTDGSSSFGAAKQGSCSSSSSSKQPHVSHHAGPSSDTETAGSSQRGSRSSNGSSSSGGGGSSGWGRMGGMPPPPRSVRMSDVQRIAMASVLLALLTSLKFATENHFGSLVDGVLEGVVQLWFVFVALDCSLTAATWIVGFLSTSVTMAVCPWCQHIFKFDSQAVSQRPWDQDLRPTVCPSCLREINFTGRSSEPFFERNQGAAFGSKTGFGKAAKPRGSWASDDGKVVDVEATVHDRD